MPRFKISRCYVNRLTWIVEAATEDEAIEKTNHEAEDDDNYMGLYEAHNPSEFEETIEILKELTKPSECTHPDDKMTVSAMMRTPKLGVVGMVECGECGSAVGNCQWVETSPLRFDLKFNIPHLKESIS